jgi:hypothetical protein
MNLRTLAFELGKSHNLLYVQKHKNKDKFDFMFSFSNNNYESLMMYKEYITDLFNEVSELIVDMPTRKLQHIISQTDLNRSSVYGFINQVYTVIDDDNFMRPSLKYIKRLEKIRDIIKRNQGEL